MMMIPLILCGGAGTRLWPVSRKEQPKQFADLGLGRTLFELTLDRAETICRRPPVIVCGDSHVAAVRGHAPADAVVLVEPAARNTAAAVLLACLALPREATVLMMPSDHYLPDHGQLARCLRDAESLTAAGKLVQIGIEARTPHTGYGYIQPGASLPDGGFAIACMKEKPSFGDALRYQAEGYLWNSGMLAFRVATLLDQFEAHAPAVLQAVRAAVLPGQIDPTAYAAVPSISLDHAILEKTSGSAVLRYDGAWSDMGSWDAIYAHGAADADNNVVHGDVEVHNTANCLIMASARVVCTSDVKDLVVIETPDAVLVADKNRPEGVKAVAEALQRRNHKAAFVPARVPRPWGWYESLTQDDVHQTKRLCVRDGQSISLQYHLKRAEHWIVIKGIATVQIGDTTQQVAPGNSVFIPVGTIHRLSAEQGDIELIEVQTGTYFGEDDIIRLADQYARS